MGSTPIFMVVQPNILPVFAAQHHRKRFIPVSLQVSADSGQQPSMKALQREVLAARCAKKHQVPQPCTSHELSQSQSREKIGSYDVIWRWHQISSNPGDYNSTQPWYWSHKDVIPVFIKELAGVEHFSSLQLASINDLHISSPYFLICFILIPCCPSFINFGFWFSWILYPLKTPS